VRIAAIQKGTPAMDKAREDELQQVSVQLGEVLNFLRKLATEVYPLVLRDLGLVEALQWESERISSPSVKVAFFTEIEDLQVDQITATHLFRSYQEKLISLIGSGATKIMSSLQLDNDLLVLAIHDNAAFVFDKENKSMEEMVIKERLRTIQGQSKINSSPNEGNRFTISITLQGQARTGTLK
jgi:signal transduction histidine kinase